jgi:hypothetical protein
MTGADFDALAAEAADARNKTGERAFIQAALSLGAWYFIGVAPPEAPDEPEPLIAPGADGHRVLVFTDEPRAEGYRDHLNAKGKFSGAGACCVLHMDIGDAVGYLGMLTDHGVGSAHFNDGGSSATVAIRRIVEMAG